MTQDRRATFDEMQADGATASQIAQRLGCSMRQVRRLRQQAATRSHARVVTPPEPEPDPAEHEPEDPQAEALAEQDRARWGDAAFQAALRAAIAAGLERMPSGEAA